MSFSKNTKLSYRATAKIRSVPTQQTQKQAGVAYPLELIRAFQDQTARELGLEDPIQSQLRLAPRARQASRVFGLD